MDRVRDMAAGISVQPSTTTSRLSSKVRPQEPALLAASSCRIQDQQPNEEHSINCTTSQHLTSLDGVEASSSEETAESREHSSAKDVNGDHIVISKDTLLFSLYPSDGNPKFDKLVKLCSKIKERAVKGKTDRQIITMLWSFLNQPDCHKRYEYQQINEDKQVQSWKTYFLIGETLCTSDVSSSKKAGKEKAVMLLISLVKQHNVIALQESCKQEAGKLGFVYEMVYVNDKPPQGCMASTNQDFNQEQNEDPTTPSAKADFQTEGQNRISVESILESLPHQFATHDLNSFIFAAPKLPGFVLYESREDQEKLGYFNPVSTIVNSCSMCKVPCEFASERCEIGLSTEGIVCTVFISHERIATGLALGSREAKHLAAHHAIRALKMTNPVLVKTMTGDGTEVNRDELTDGPSKEVMLPETNVGHKLLKMMGWKGEGAGLGKREDGIANPVKATGSGSKTKEGLGCDMASLRNPHTKRLEDRKVWEYLQEFARSDREDELVFTSELTIDERKRIHGIALKLGLKSKSRGKGDSRYLIVGRKWSVDKLVQAVEEKGGSMGGYELHGPPL